MIKVAVTSCNCPVEFPVELVLRPFAKVWKDSTLVILTEAEFKSWAESQEELEWRSQLLQL